MPRYTLPPQDPSLPEPAPALLNVALGVLVLAALVLAVFIAGRLLGGKGPRGPVVAAVVYFPGTTQLAAPAPVRWGSREVGEVVRVTPGVPALQLQIWPGRFPEVGEVATLTNGQGLAVPDEDLRLVLAGPDSLVLARAGAEGALRREGAGRWRLVGSPAAWPDSVNRGATAKAAADSIIRTGDLLRWGDAALRWNDYRFHTRVDLELAEARLLGAAEATFPGVAVGVGRLLGPGTGLKLESTLGLTRPRLQLEPGFVAPDSLVRGATVREFLPGAGTDPLGALAGLTGYLSDPAALREPPVNRLQTMVNDANVGLDNFRASLTNIRQVLDRENGQGGVGRLLLGTTAQGNLNRFLARTDSLGGSLNDLLDVLNGAARGDSNQGAVLRLLVSKPTEASLDSTLRNIERLSRELSDSSRTMLARVVGDSTAARVDSLLRSADSMVVQLDSTLRAFENTANEATPTVRTINKATRLISIVGTILKVIIGAVLVDAAISK